MSESVVLSLTADPAGSGGDAAADLPDGDDPGAGDNPGAGAEGDLGAGDNPGAGDPGAITELVHRLHAGDIRADQLPLELRQQCVAHLALDGFTTSEIAQLMRTSERTIRRDRVAIRRDGAVQPNLTLGDELLGEFQRIMLASIQRLTRLVREPDTPPYVRLWAEEAIVRSYERFIRTAHRLHYLEDGEPRLAHQRNTDPARTQRFREEMAAVQMLLAPLPIPGQRQRGRKT